MISCAETGAKSSLRFRKKIIFIRMPVTPTVEDFFEGF